MIESLLHAERLLLHGMIDQAEALYRSTLDADPRNAIALVGLARVALERGDDGLAYRQACLALEIDDRNPAALRLEARLSEVLAARGEPVERPAWLATKPTGQPAAQPASAPDSPSERAVFTRNRSMADHRRMETDRDEAAPAGGEAPAPDAADPTADPAAVPAARRRLKRRGVLRRLLGR